MIDPIALQNIAKLPFKFDGAAYIRPMAKTLEIIDRNGNQVPFLLERIQEEALKEFTGRDVILKARQMGFSALILGILTMDFLTRENSRSVCIAHDAGVTQKLLDRVKFYIKTFEQQTGLQVPFKINNRNEMINAAKNSSFYIGTAGSRDFGRGDTITNLHLSEFAFYPDPEKMLSGVMQAVPQSGRVFIETTANGYNFFKKFWEECKLGQRAFTPHFFSWREFYDEKFIDQKKLELGRLFRQEYPETDTEAFLTSGECYFNKESLEVFLHQSEAPQMANLIYG